MKRLGLLALLLAGCGGTAASHGPHGSTSATSGSGTSGASASSSSSSSSSSGSTNSSSSSSTSTSGSTSSSSTSTSGSTGTSSTSSSSTSTSTTTNGSTSSTSTSTTTSGTSSGSTSTSTSTGTSGTSTGGSTTGGFGGPPCEIGSGQILFKFHYESGYGTNAVVDVYPPDSSNWEATPVYSTSFTDEYAGGGIEIASGNYILIRYSAVGLSQINSATFGIFGRSFDTTASGSFDAWSPDFGDDASPQDSVWNSWPYNWTSVDYSSQLAVGEAPASTGIELSAGPSSSDLVINTVELCIDGQ